MTPSTCAKPCSTPAILPSPITPSTRTYISASGIWKPRIEQPMLWKAGVAAAIVIAALLLLRSTLATPPLHYWVPSIGPSGLAIYTGARFPKWHENIFVGGMADRAVGKELYRIVLNGQAHHQESLL